MNRFRLTSLIALLAAFGLIVAGCGDSNKSSSSSSGLSPEQRVKTALQNASKINSGSVTIDASISGAGMPGKMKLTGGGKFDTKAKGGPAVDMQVKFDMGFGGEPQEIGLVSVGGKSYLKFGGKFYAADEMMQGITGATGSTQKTAIDAKDFQKLMDSLDGYVSDAKASGTQKVGDETLDVYSATIDVKKVMAEAQKQAGSALDSLSALGGTGDLTDSVGETTVEIGIDGNDLPRSFKIKSSMEGGATGSTSGGGTVEASLVLTEVNQPVTIEAPEKVEEGASLLEAFGSMLGGMGASGMGATGMMGQ
ncbi:MAG: hypothetical protein HZB14_08075 [Actinobacteria bacterium]|nr:hypothetical protein [Actinomycetota bacterium]